MKRKIIAAQLRLLIRGMLAAVPLLALAASSVDAAPRSSSLFENIDQLGPVEQAQALDLHTLRRSFATLDIARFKENARSLKNEELVLELFPDVVIRAVKSHVELRSDESYSWFGQVQGDSESNVVLSVVEGKLAGVVIQNGEMFRIEALVSGNYSITEVDQSSFPPEHGAYDGGSLGVTQEALEALAERNANANRTPTESNTEQPEVQRVDVTKYILFSDAIMKILNFSYTVNIGVVYTGAVAFGGEHPNLQAEIQLAVDLTNQSFIASGIFAQLTLSATGMVSYSETGNILTDIQRLQGKSDGYMDSIHATRDLWNWKADIITLLVEDGGDKCGRGYQLDEVEADPTGYAEWAFNVVRADCMVDNLSFAHEVGHNLGAGHDWYVDPNAAPSSYNHGYIVHDKKKRTIMAYWQQCYDLGYDCPKALRFSNPNVVLMESGSFIGSPLGVPAGQYQAADNHKEINENRSYVANFR